MDRQGAVQPLKLPPGPYVLPRASPDGRRIAFGTDDGKEAIIWTYDLSGTRPMQRLTSGGNNRFPIWSPDGKRIAFQSDRAGDLAIFWQPADGTGAAERLTTPDQGASHAPESWSPTENVFLFSVTKGSDVSLSSFSLPERTATPLATVHSSATPGAAFSPNGRWIAYSTWQRGAMTLYVEPYPTTGKRYPLLAKGSDSPKQPRWSPDGTELFYNPRTTGFEAVGVTTQPTVAFGHPVAVPKRIRFGPPGARTPYDVTPDGKFLGLIEAGQQAYNRGSDDQILVVLNWTEELKRLVPTR
jgi:Tol biopolymer transport system component